MRVSGKMLIGTGIILLLILFVWTTPPSTSSGTVKIYDRKGGLLFELAGNTGRKTTVPYNRFPQHLKQAVIAAEDESFYQNFGIDLKAASRSLLLNVQSGKIVSGASTITQQTARLNSQANSENLFYRIISKIRENIMAVRMSFLYSKEDILTMYLNGVYLGNHNYSFQSAAEFYFHKNVDKLSLNESAYLAGMIASPSKYDPYQNPTQGHSRKAYVLQRMGANGFITREVRDDMIKIPCEFANAEDTIIAPHFVDYITEQLSQLNIPSKNISVYTTIDTDAYRLSLRIARYWVNKLKDKHNIHNAAMIVLDNKTGAIISMLGGIDYFDSINHGQVNLVTSLRQPGSAIKPITYTSAFLNKITPATLIYDVKTSYMTKKNEGFIPNNFGDKYHGLVLVREALASSYNLPAVEVLRRIGLNTFIKTAKNLGITSYANPSAYDYSITLGANEVSLLELSNAYATLAREGMFVKPYSIEKVIDGKNKIIYTHPVLKAKQVLGPDGPQATYLVTNILSDNLARMPGFGEKNYLTLSRPAVVKTGTTSDWHDIWTIGYTPSYTVGVWMGNTNNEAMQSISSAEGAAPVWNQFFEEFLKDKQTEEFIKPDKIVTREICSLSGDLYDSVCPERKSEIFIEGTQPQKKSSFHKVTRIDVRNGLLATDSCPAVYVENKILIDYPDKVYTWAVANSKPYVPHEYSPLCNFLEDRVSTPKQLFISITNPKNKAVYQNAPGLIRNQGIPLEVNVSSNIASVAWYLDNVKVGETTKSPFLLFIPLQTGNHIVYAEGRSKNLSVKSKPVNFSVVDFH
ncbi:MAG: transglycosylase domain-containing protein [Candidatus Levybacteria bacterium]|nr:transglycosylase domain-containing protein [Candidatus Levybacteria bacterium]